jgi:NADH-quinone oxidoreductase subunit K
MRLTDVLLLATLLFSIGLYGVLTRRHAVALLLSIELMANAANVVFVAFATLRGGPGEVLVLFALVVTVSEVAVGLALVMLLYRRHGDTVLDLAREARH